MHTAAEGDARHPENRVDGTDRCRIRWPIVGVCFLLGLLGTLPLVILTPPFQIPDEQQHLFRVYQLGELSLSSEVRDGKAGAVLPASLVELADTFLGTRAIHVEARPIVKRSAQEISRELDRPLEPGRREFVDFTGAAFYSPLAYLPQLAGVLLGRFLDAGPLGLLYLGRLMNALAGVALVALAAGIAPVGGRSLMLAGLLPMAAFLYASLSPDTMVIGTAFLFTAVVLRGLRAARCGGGDLAIAALSGLVFCSLKPPYAPLLMLALPGLLQPGRRLHVLLVQSFILLVALGGTVLWLRYSTSALVLPRAGTDIAAQLSGITADPVAFVGVLARSVLWNWRFYAESLIGSFGWLSVRPPLLLVILPVIGLGLAMVTGPGEPRGLCVASWLWTLMMAIASIALVFTAVYLYWTPVGAVVVDGVQGRYLLPALAAALVAFASAAPIRLSHTAARLSLAGLIAVIAVSLLTTQLVILRTYYPV